MKSEGPVSAGEIAFLGLDDIREKLGEMRWERFNSAIHQLIEKIIIEICGPTDAYFKVSGEQYLLIFSNTTEDIAEVKAATIGTRIEQALFGKDGLEGVKVVTAGRSSDGIDEMLTRSPRAVLDDARERTERRRASLIAQTPEDAIEMELASTGSSFDRQARRAKLFQSLNSAKAQPMSYRFIPFWHAPTRKVATFQCVGFRHVSLTGSSDVGYSVLGMDPAQDAIIQYDVDVMEESLLGLTGSLQRDTRVHVALTLHFETVGSTVGRDRITEVLKVVPQDIRSFLTILICGIPSGVPPTRLADVCAYLKPFCQSISIDVEREWALAEYRSLFMRLRGVGIQYFGIRMRKDGGRSEVQELVDIAKIGNKYGLSGVVSNVSSAADALELTSGGYEYCGGALFGGPFEGLPAPFIFTTGDLERV